MAIGLHLSSGQQQAVYQPKGSSRVTAYATSSPAAVTNKLTFSPVAGAAAAGTGFTPQANYVYRFCVFPDMTISESVTTTPSKCGVYHTFTAGYQSSGTKIDRHLGSYISSSGYNSTITGNKYNISFFASYLGSGVAGDMNFGVVVLRNSGTSAWSGWTGVAYENRAMYNQDATILRPSGYIGDYVIYGQQASSIKEDNDTRSNFGCSNSLTAINGAVAADYSLMHVSRPLFSLDMVCDSPVAVNFSELCVVFKELVSADSSLLLGSTAKHDKVFCALFEAGRALASALALLTLYTFV